MKNSKKLCGFSPEKVPTAGPRLTRILGPEKNRVRRNRTIGGLWDYTI